MYEFVDVLLKQLVNEIHLIERDVDLELLGFDHFHVFVHLCVGIVVVAVSSEPYN